jgi:hypothetical protein
MLDEWRKPRRLWSRRTKVVAPALALAWAVVAEWGLDRADGAAPSAVAMGCVAPDGGTCRAWARKKAQQFKDGEIGNSHARPTRHLKRKINRWFDNHPKVKAREMAEDGVGPSAAGEWCSWCDFFPESINCMAYLVVQPGRCRENAETIRSIQREVTRVVVTCGGAALIAFKVGRSPQAGIAAGVLSCFWSDVAAAIFRYGCRTHRRTCEPDVDRDVASEPTSSAPQGPR